MGVFLHITSLPTNIAARGYDHGVRSGLVPAPVSTHLLENEPIQSLTGVGRVAQNDVTR